MLFPFPALALSWTFSKKILTIDDQERSLLAKITTEAQNFLKGRLDDPYQTVLEANPHSAISGQLICLYLEEFLLHLYERHTNPSLAAKSAIESPAKTIRENSETKLFEKITAYMSDRLSMHLTIEQICRENSIRRTQLQKLFSEKGTAWHH